MEYLFFVLSQNLNVKSSDEGRRRRGGDEDE